MQKGFKTEVLKPFMRLQPKAEEVMGEGLVAAASTAAAAVTAAAAGTTAAAAATVAATA